MSTPETCIHCYVMIELQRRQAAATAAGSDEFIGDAGMHATVGKLIECICDIVASHEFSEQLTVIEFAAGALARGLRECRAGQWKPDEVAAHFAVKQ